MKNSKDILRHKLLNIITIVSIWFDEKNFKDVSRPTSLLKLAGLIVAYEKAFLGERFDFFIQPCNIRDTIYIAICSNEDIIRKKKIDIANFKNDVIIDVDRYFFSESINQIFTTLLKISSKNIHFWFNEKNKNIEISFDGKINPNIVNKSLIESLDQKDIDIDEIGFLLALNILKQLGKEIEIEQHKISITA